MIIEKGMPLLVLADLIGEDATIEDAVRVRDALLTEGFAGTDILDVPESTWMRCAYQS
ncbi:hypothetical protein [Burkholderia multivorans]|uniref:hypothetical protein n=1 Tax=Burkholderia multivorans TaxID=87883 RepID=UPI00158AC0B3|nr:hypothetical protein [Burkholderia multivorans]MDR8920513.1 hypothetical protein [Burkholderia multivorans]MDR8921918.1 hypothetical protein [Burkholderia multivorans]MDR8965951.1 hypothetical protein [Burkholderia multivorans]MDR8988575.1 hypothetical protein [Burkholderia multivorans]MDR9019574.1 hypothetical protein [Burkholderia multivorans]